MKKVHYRNIGLPKTGTTWLSLQLLRNPFIDYNLSSEFKEYRPNSYDSYIKLYKDFNISFNFDSQVFSKINDESHFNRPENIHKHTTHLSISLRNPYEILNSMYNMSRNINPNNTDDKTSYTTENGYHINLYCNMKEIFDYWSNCKLTIKFLIFDDLKNDPKKYVLDICEYIGIQPFYDKKLTFQLTTKINDRLIFDSNKVISYINNSISIIEDKIKRDLSHWKK